MRRTIAAALLMLAPMMLARPALAGQMTYLSLGDSLAFGETDFTKDPSGGNRGYVNAYSMYLAGQNGGVAPNVVNLAIDGETSTSLTTGAGRVGPDSSYTDKQLEDLNNHYAGNDTVSQNTKFIQAIGNQLAKGNTISNVTISLGGNDLFALVGTPGFLTASAADQQTMLTAALTKFAGNYSNLLGEVRGLLPDAHVALLGTYNPFPANPNSPLSPVAAPVIQALNATIQKLAAGFGADYVDTYTPFVGHEADYTYMSPTSTNIHPNAKGYAAIAGAIEAVPEPSTLAVLALGGALIAFRARRRLSA